MTSEEMEIRYREGQSLKEIGKLAGLAHTTVRIRLIDRGVNMRRRGRIMWGLRARQRQERKDAKAQLIKTIADMRLNEMSFGDIAEQTSQTRNQVAGIVRRHIKK